MGRHRVPPTIAVIDLHRLFRGAEWMRDALCGEPDYADVSFFPNGPVQSRRARAVCARCLVATECALYALDHGITEGLWGGMSHAERVDWKAARLIVSSGRHRPRRRQV